MWASESNGGQRRCLTVALIKSSKDKASLLTWRFVPDAIGKNEVLVLRLRTLELWQCPGIGTDQLVMDTAQQTHTSLWRLSASSVR